MSVDRVSFKHVFGFFVYSVDNVQRYVVKLPKMPMPHEPITRKNYS